MRVMQTIKYFPGDRQGEKTNNIRGTQRKTTGHLLREESNERTEWKPCRPPIIRISDIKIGWLMTMHHHLLPIL